MLNEIFKNGVAWLVGAIASGTACVAFTIETFNDHWIPELIRSLFN